MRLTLRTLLAYLDNTLDPQDAEALRDKLGESGFATQLVQRIRGSLSNGSLPAPSPEAVGPVEEANVISEYLDSTLPTEQVAEIERACLESDPHLAEAAACHQILTMILGKPAEVSPELRKRVYELPDRKIEDIAAAGSFSSVAIPTDQPQLGSLASELPTSDITSGRDGEPVEPVGVSDSGVSDAPTRLREAERSDGGKAGRSSTAIAGSSPRSAEGNVDTFAGSFRPSRIAPWIVSLALAGVLLFALTRIFQPLLNPDPIASVENGGLSGVSDQPEIVISAEESPVMVEVESSAAEADSSDSVNESAETLPEALPAPSATPSAADLAVVEPTAKSNGESDSSAASETSESATMEPPAPSESATSSVAATAANQPNTGQPNAGQPNTEATALTPTDSVMPPEANSDTASSATNPAGADAAVPPPAGEVVAPKLEIAQITSKETLLAGLAGDQWVRLKQDTMVGEGLKIACAPTFRGNMQTDDALVTLVGPAQVEWILGAEDRVSLRVDYGRILVSATKPNTTLHVQLGDQPIELNLGDIDTVGAASIKYFRAPGFDPLKPEYHIPLTGILSVQGKLRVQGEGRDDLLDTGKQWVKRGTAEVQVSPVESVPDWIDPPDPNESTLQSSARSGLLELLKGDQPLEITLREATLFRRSEVGALAGQTLLNLGRADVYFGGDGILSDPKQRAYWPDHYQTLLATVDRSAESAQRLIDSMTQMDSANEKPLFRLLRGFSQKQLVEGGDEELVQLLDSSSMSVRVLALENLHKITGTTLYFRAEQENAVRRAPVIKKWIARQRKGDIRWQE